MFKKLSITGMSLEEFKEIFDYKKMPLEKEKDALLRTAKDNKGKIVEVERDEETKKLKKKKKKKLSPIKL